MKAFLQNFVVTRLISQFVGQVPGAIQSHLNVSELLRIAFTTALATGSAAGVLPALLSQVGAFVAAPDVALATAILTTIIEVIRRLGHGTAAPKLNLP